MVNFNTDVVKIEILSGRTRNDKLPIISTALVRR